MIPLVAEQWEAHFHWAMFWNHLGLRAFIYILATGTSWLRGTSLHQGVKASVHSVDSHLLEWGIQLPVLGERRGSVFGLWSKPCHQMQHYQQWNQNFYLHPSVSWLISQLVQNSWKEWEWLSLQPVTMMHCFQLWFQSLISFYYST